MSYTILYADIRRVIIFSPFFLLNLFYYVFNILTCVRKTRSVFFLYTFSYRQTTSRDNKNFKPIVQIINMFFFFNCYHFFYIHGGLKLNSLSLYL